MRGKAAGWIVASLLQLSGTGAPAQPSIEADPQALHINTLDYLEAQGLSVLVYQNRFHEVFRDQKLGGIEMILHGERIATGGEVRLLPAPEQWDAVPTFTQRKHGAGAGQLVAYSGYPDQQLSYRIEVTAEHPGFRIAVHLDRALPPDLVGKAGFNLDFLPTAYFGKSYVFDDSSGIFPRYPEGPMERGTDGMAQPRALSSGHRIVLAPEDPLTRVSIVSDGGVLSLFDARNRAQNGWFVVRGLLPAGRTENALVWHLRPNVVPNWVRAPVVSYNQAGYTPQRPKIAVLELDPHYDGPKTARIMRLNAAGGYEEVFRASVKHWGRWLRYRYASFDFSPVREAGVYAIDYAGQTHGPFRIADDVYDRGVWQPSLDTFLAVQMDHVKVRENYRVWHGASHMDDARQAPANTTHFDGYAMPAASDSPFAAGEHIPGLNIGGWYDAGDYDIRTETQARVITDLALARETFHIDWDETTVDEEARLVRIRRPDGIPDVLQQIEHGVLGLLAQYAAFGHAIPGIVEPTLEEYTHLGDAASKTDGKVYSPRMGTLQSDGVFSGVPDDRWAFTSHTTPLNYAAAASLAAASRVLRGFDDALAAKSLDAAVRVWNDEHSHPPVIFRSFNTTGGEPEDEEVRAAVELLIATRGEAVYKRRLNALLPAIRGNFSELGWTAARALPYMDSGFKAALTATLREFKAKQAADLSQNPYGVPIRRGTWGGSAAAAAFAVHMYYLHRAFPDIVGTDETLRGFDYVLGMHPVNSVSYVSTVGTVSKLIAYGNNRADYTFIPGGMIPGVVIIEPDYPELKDAWPFLWYENEYVVDAASTFILAANAAQALTHPVPWTAAPIRSIAIVGGGTAGWMTAASLCKFLSALDVRIRLIESEQIATVGVGEATIPPIMDFIRGLGVDENECIRRTQGTFKLGIEFRDWTRIGHSYIHPFGQTGFDMGPVAFQAYWLKAFRAGRASRLEDYSLQAAAAYAGKFMRPVPSANSPLQGITYALHFDASLFARYLRGYAEDRGVERTEGRVKSVSLKSDNGFIDALTLESGERVEADLYIDCSGFRGLLIEEALHTGYDNWNCWLPCDRAVAAQCERTGPLSSYTRATAKAAGWQWRIPLQHRLGTGYVYSSGFSSDALAQDEFMSSIEGKALIEPFQLRFAAGRRKRCWNGNCVAIGLSSGFLEPLESTSIHLIQRGIAMLLTLFPDRHFRAAEIDRYNKILALEYERIRDFLILHYSQTERDDSDLWRHCRNAPMPDSLRERIDLFRSHGRILRENFELFPAQSWLFVMVGQNVMPESDDPLVGVLDPQLVNETLANIRSVVRQCVQAMPTHEDFIRQNCSAAAVTGW